MARRTNHVRIASLTGGPVLDWILASGLTQEEAARIQPGYDFLGNTGVDRRRVQGHLYAVIAQLRDRGEESLALAQERLARRMAVDPVFRLERMRDTGESPEPVADPPPLPHSK